MLLVRKVNPDMVVSRQLKHLFYEKNLPPDLDLRLEKLYQCPFCVKSYFELFRDAEKINLLMLWEGESLPRHILVYTVSGRTVTILNELVKIEPEYAEHGADALFSRYPAVTTIHFNCMKMNITESRYPWRLWKRSQDIAIALPSTFEAYQGVLGQQTRKHLRYYQNRLQRDYADVVFHDVATEQIDPAAIGEIIEMNRLRMESKGIRSGFDSAAEERIKKFCRQYGLITTLRAGGKIIAGAICYEVGNQVYLEAIAHDSAFDRYNPGQLCLYLTVQQLIRRGRESFHLLWGENEYKYRFLGVKQELYFFSFYRSAFHRRACLPQLTSHLCARLFNQGEYLIQKYVIRRFGKRR